MPRAQNRRVLLVAVAGAALAAGIGGVILGRTLLAPEPARQEAAEPGEETSHPEGFLEITTARLQAAGIKTETAAAGALGAEIIAQAMVAAAPDGAALVAARADGTVTQIRKRLGESVKAGETLASLESRDAAAIAAEHATASAKAQAARALYMREKRLYDAKITARQDLEAAQAALAEAEAELRRTQAALSAAHVSPDGRHVLVTSPISGQITAIRATLGAHVQADAELFRVADPRRIQINAAIPPIDAHRLATGDPAVVEGREGPMPAVVRSVTPAIDPESRAATAVLALTGDGGGLPLGQSVRVRITPKTPAEAGRIILPDEAVQTVEGRAVVFVRQGEGFQVRDVVAGARSGGRVEIIEGLKPGETVATANAFLLKAELSKGEAEDHH